MVRRLVVLVVLSLLFAPAVARAADDSPPFVDWRVLPGEVASGAEFDAAVVALDGDGIDRVAFSTGGATVTAARGANDIYTARLPTTGLAAGPQMLTVNAYDGAGNVATAAVPFTVTLAPPEDDYDGDGFISPADCDPFDTTIHPGATDVADDGVDQDCDGKDTPAPNNARIAIKTVAVGTRTKIVKFDVTGLPVGATIVLSCAGKGCPFKRPQTVPTRTGKDSHLAPGFAKQRFAAGTVLTTVVSGPYTTAKTFSFRMRAHKAPVRG